MSKYDDIMNIANKMLSYYTPYLRHKGIKAPAVIDVYKFIDGHHPLNQIELAIIINGRHIIRRQYWVTSSNEEEFEEKVRGFIIYHIGQIFLEGFSPIIERIEKENGDWFFKTTPTEV